MEKTSVNNFEKLSLQIWEEIQKTEEKNIDAAFLTLQYQWHRRVKDMAEFFAHTNISANSRP